MRAEWAPAHPSSLIPHPSSLIPHPSSLTSPMTPPFTLGAQRLWRCASAAMDGREELARAVGVSPTVAGLLMARGCADPDAAYRFLHPSLSDLHDPFLLPDMEAAVTRLAHALEAGEKVLIHGDYDVDGISTFSPASRACASRV